MQEKTSLRLLFLELLKAIHAAQSQTMNSFNFRGDRALCNVVWRRRVTPWSHFRIIK